MMAGRVKGTEAEPFFYVRSGGQWRYGDDDDGRVGRDGGKMLSHLRFLLRWLYTANSMNCPDGSAGNGAAGKRHHPGCVFRTDPSGKACGHADWRNW